MITTRQTNQPPGGTTEGLTHNRGVMTNGADAGGQRDPSARPNEFRSGVDDTRAPAPIVPASAFLDDPPDSSYLIKNVLPRQGIAQLFGSSNVGKSFLALDMAAAVISGQDWHGSKVRRGPVLYVASEGISGLKLRLKVLSIHKDSRLDGLHVQPAPIELTDPQSLTKFIANIAAMVRPAPVCIIIDTLHGNFGTGSENDVEAMSAAVSSLRALARKGDWLVLTVHHSGHQEKARSRGHSSLTAALDVEVRAERKTGGTVEVCHTKARDFERMTPMFFRLESVRTGWFDEDNEPLTSAVVVEAEIPEGPSQPRGANQRRALAAIQEQAAKQGTDILPISTVHTILEPIDKHAGHRNNLLESLSKCGQIRLRGAVTSSDCEVELP